MSTILLNRSQERTFWKAIYLGGDGGGLGSPQNCAQQNGQKEKAPPERGLKSCLESLGGDSHEGIRVGRLRGCIKVTLPKIAPRCE